MMNIHVYDSSRKASLAAAHLFFAQLLEKPDSVLGLATGSTPLETYAALAKWHKEGLLDFSRSQSFNLDEYVGLAGDHAASYRKFMEDNLFSKINFKHSDLPSGIAKSLSQECRRYDKAIEKAGGIDIQFLGIGNNGHIGFNEPDDQLSYGTKVIDLTQNTIEANRRFFNHIDEVPRKAISMGLGSIMQAKKIVLVALGKGKAEAVKQMVKGDISPRLPASFVRLHHNAVVFLDKEAASLL